MDITNFMTWFITQVINMFKTIFTTLDDITFSGTSLLKIIITISILSALIPVLLTIVKSSRVTAERSSKVSSKHGKETNEKD